MEIRTYLGILKTRLWLIILCLGLAVGTSYYYTSQLTPSFSATVKLAIDPNAKVQLFPFMGQGGAVMSSYRDPLTSLAASYQEYLHSQNFTTLAVQRLNLSMDPGLLAGMVSTSLVDNTTFLHLRVSSADPKEAQRIANGVVNLMLEQLDEKANSGPQAEIRQLVEYYRPKIESLRVQRDRIENDMTISIKDKLPLLNSIDAQLTPMEDLYLKLRTATGEIVPANEIPLMGKIGVESALRPNAEAMIVMDWANIPTMPDSSITMKMMLFAALAAMALGVGLVFLFEYMDDRVKTPRHLRDALGVGPLAVIGKIPNRGKRGLGIPIPFRRRRPRDRSALPNRYSRKLVTALDPLHPDAEAFRLARTIVLAGESQISRSILVTSAGPGEGKSLTLGNLATAIAQAGRRVIAVDADVRKPSLHRVFGLSNEAGFCAALAGEGGVTKWLQKTAIENLRVLTAGVPRSSVADVLSSSRLTEVISQLKACADVVIVDSPALSAASEGLLLASKLDAVLLIADASHTTTSAVIAARNGLNQMGADLLGVILTRSSEKKKGYYRARIERISKIPRLGECLIKCDALTADQLQSALEHQEELASKGQRRRLGEVLVDLGYVSTEKIDEATVYQHFHSNGNGKASGALARQSPGAAPEGRDGRSKSDPIRN